MSQPMLGGRVPEHDETSKRFPAPSAPVKTIRWTHHGDALDQARTSTCCSQAMTQAMNTDPHFQGRLKVVEEAFGLHWLTTREDDFPDNEWPKYNEGSSVLAAAKAAKKRKWIHGYEHAFGADHFFQAMQSGPLVLGTRWTAGMQEPDTTGVCRAVGETRMWHAWLAYELDVDRGMVTGLNSWGPTWAHQGSFYLPFEDMFVLLDRDDDSDALLPIAFPHDRAPESIHETGTAGKNPRIGRPPL